MATLHLMIGLPCSGKTTYAKQLEKEAHALLLTPDVWLIKLNGTNTIQNNHDTDHDTIEKIMWDVAERVLTLGGNVILDFGFWAKEERDDFRNRSKKLGVGFQLHYMDTPVDELFRRLEIRNKAITDQSFVIPKEEMEKYRKIFQPPTAEELANDCVYGDGTRVTDCSLTQNLG